MYGKPRPRHEKLKAVGAFGVIAAVSAVAFDLMLFGGFQVDPPAAGVAPADRRVEMTESGWRSNYTTTSTAWSDEVSLPPEVITEELAGDTSGTSDRGNATYDVPSEDELYEEIAALYAEQDRNAAARAEEHERAEALNDEHFAEDPDDDDKSATASDNPEPVIASENESPW